MIFLSFILLTQALFQEDQEFLGVASCASSACHGSSSALKGSSIERNEFSLWANQDAHSRSWKVLVEPSGQRIGENLGIENPEQSKVCLDCHAPAVSNASSRFRIEDGVQCETCHGSAKNYLRPHSDPKSSHRANVDLGLTDLSDLNRRANLCIDCHFENKELTHRLYGAGHPRISFELDTFSAIQPAHWKNDADYSKRKGLYHPAKAWAIGQWVRGGKILDRLSSNSMAEFSVLNCYSCHHGLKQEQWRHRDYGQKPGELRLHLSSLEILEIIFRSLKPDLALEIKEALEKLKQKDSAQIAKLKNLLEDNPISDLILEKNTIIQILRHLALAGTQVVNLQYETAEQIAMGISSLVSELSTSNYKSEIAAIYKSLQNPESFDTRQFSRACAALEKLL